MWYILNNTNYVLLLHNVNINSQLGLNFHICTSPAGERWISVKILLIHGLVHVHAHVGHYLVTTAVHVGHYLVTTAVHVGHYLVTTAVHVGHYLAFKVNPRGVFFENC